MSGTLWLITEGASDGYIVGEILKRRYPQLRLQVLKPTTPKRNLSRLAQQVERLIKQALAEHKQGDCVAVLHDLDMQTRPHAQDREDYESIRRVCEKYRADIILVLAHDEIEAWILADEGMCRWLGTKPKNWDEQRQPSVELNRLLDKAKKPKFTIENIPKILLALDGTGDKHSPSLRKALEHLADAPCTRL